VPYKEAPGGTHLLKADGGLHLGAESDLREGEEGYWRNNEHDKVMIGWMQASDKGKGIGLRLLGKGKSKGTQDFLLLCFP
jgi:hypothetical protein